MSRIILPKQHTSRRPTFAPKSGAARFLILESRRSTSTPHRAAYVPLWYQYRCSTCALKINIHVDEWRLDYLRAERDAVSHFFEKSEGRSARQLARHPRSPRATTIR